MGEIIHLNEPEIKKQLEGMVREKVEETLNTSFQYSNQTVGFG